MSRSVCHTVGCMTHTVFFLTKQIFFFCFNILYEQLVGLELLALPKEAASMCVS